MTHIPGVVAMTAHSVRKESRPVEPEIATASEPICEPVVEVQPEVVLPKEVPVKYAGLSVYGQNYAEDGLTLEWRQR